jgi:CheY-like chemotaxis protein
MTRVLDVGQCGFDHGAIAHYLRQAFGAEVVRAATFSEAVDALRRSSFSLVLVNRETDADGASGLDLIRTLKTDPTLASTPVMLVSNFPDAQRAAESLGALSGFGKSNLMTSDTRARLATALAGAEGA